MTRLIIEKKDRKTGKRWNVKEIRFQGSCVTADYIEKLVRAKVLHGDNGFFWCRNNENEYAISCIY